LLNSSEPKYKYAVDVFESGEPDVLLVVSDFPSMRSSVFVPFALNMATCDRLK